MRTFTLIITFVLTFTFAKGNVDCIWESRKSGVWIRYIAPCDFQTPIFLDSFINKTVLFLNRQDTSLKILVLVGNGKQKFSLPGFIFKKGTFTADDSTKIVRVSFDSSYSVFSNDSSVVKKDSATQDWHLISVTNHKIVLSRPPVWDFEKGCNQNEGKNIIVTMDGGKKKQKGTKFK